MMKTVALEAQVAPKSVQLLRDGLLIVGGSLLIALAAQVRIPSVPVPITLQSMAVLVVAGSLGSRRGMLAVAAYLLEGIAGLPVFAMWSAGPAYLLGTTGGYLIGFLPAAFIVGYFCERGWGGRFRRCLPVFIAGQCFIVLVGTAWLARVGELAGLSEVVWHGAILFVPGLLLKSVVAAMIVPMLRLKMTRSAPELPSINSQA